MHSKIRKTRKNIRKKKNNKTKTLSKSSTKKNAHKRWKTNKGGSIKTTLKNKKAKLEKDKLKIEKTRPLNLREYEEWYEAVAGEELRSQLPYMKYLAIYAE